MEILIVFLPLLAAIIVGLQTRTLSVKTAQIITCSGTIISALLSAIIFHQVVILGEPRVIELFTWINSGDFKVNWALRVDSLTAIMLVLVTWVSSLVHIYSIGYMSHDPHPQRFMSYLSLFTFFMLMLVTSDNFLQLYLGWEGVGLCSYLLIGFWYKKESANAAAMKAFIVNRVGDFGFALGILVIYFIFGSIQFTEVFAAAGNYTDRYIAFAGTEFHALTAICILLFIGAMGKSAQLGLHTWLPDAMEGPTPVSALIHAATMVTAGVFMVARCSALFEQSEFALAVVTVVGAVTCLFAATIAITQNDIKKVIAYSTCSQLGYMFFACGVSAYSAGIFHLMTHGFFKALLFLGAGSVIHAMSNEQDMRMMGGLRKKIPVTYWLMIIGTIAIVGFPPLSGYFSKDMVLESAYAAGSHGNIFGAFAYWVGIIAATLTAFYSFRLIFMTFHGEPRASKVTMSHVHESPKIMLSPLYVLAFGAVFAGVGASSMGITNSDTSFFWGDSIYVEPKVAIKNLDGEYVDIVQKKMVSTDIHEDFNVLEAAQNVPTWVRYSPMIVGIFGLFAAWICYILNPRIPVHISRIFKPIYEFLLNKWYFDELYEWLFIKPIKKIGYLFWKIGDVIIVDGLGPNGFAFVSSKVAVVFSRLQTGYVYHYAFVMLIGLVGIFSWYLFN